MISELLAKLDGYNTATRDLFARIDAIGRAFYEEHRDVIDEAERLYEIVSEKQTKWRKENPETAMDALRDIPLGQLEEEVEPGSFHGEEDYWEIIYQESIPEFEERRQADNLLAPLREKLKDHLEREGYKYQESGLTKKTLFAISRACDPFSLQSDDINESEAYIIYCQLAGEILAAELGTRDFRAIGWGAGNDPIALYMPGEWRYLNLDSDRALEGKISSISFDVTHEGLPAAIKPESSDVAMIKTLGTVDSSVLHQFWVKIDLSLRKGGLVLSSYDLPEEFRSRYQRITNLADTGRDLLQFEELTQRVPFYIPAFYTGSELKLYRKRNNQPNKI